MSLRTQHDLAELRRQRARSAASPSVGLAHVLRAGFERLSLTAPTDAGATRGGRLPHEKPAFDRDRRYRLTASMLPFWLGLQGTSRDAVTRTEIIRILGEFDGLYSKPPVNEYVREIMEYGRVHEVYGIIGYMEITRSLVGLGSTRIRTTRADGEFPESWDASNPAHQWEWHDVLSATPDGFVLDALDSGLGRGLGFKGLLEVKCPASRHPVNGIPRRHNPEVRLKAENDSYTLLQCFQQLLVCTEAKYVDIVHFKRAGLNDPQTGVTVTHDFVWIARLYRHDRHMQTIRALIKDSVELFAKALHAMRHDDESDTEDEDTIHAREARQANEFAAKIDRDDAQLSKRHAGRKATLPLSERKAILAALKAWTNESLRWRNGLEPEAGYPWRSINDLTTAGKNPNGLCHRYHVNTGQVHNHSFPSLPISDAGETSTVEVGYRLITPPPTPSAPYLGRPLEARDLWGTEPIGFHGSPPEGLE